MEAIEITQRVLNAQRKSKLEYYDSEIPKRMGYLVTILTELQNDKLEPYLLTHDSMQAYLSDKFGVTARRIQQIMAGEEVKKEVMKLMPEAAARLGTMKERAAREIVTTPPPKRLELIQEAVKTPGKITAAKLRQVKDRILKPLPPVDAEIMPVAPYCPHCGQPLPA